MKRYISKIFIIDRFFEIKYSNEKISEPSKIWLGRIFRPNGEIEVLHSFKGKSELYKKIVLYHLYFIFENNDRDTIHADTCAFEQLFLEGYSIKQVSDTFIELVKDMPCLSRSFQEFKIKRIENLKSFLK